MRGIVQIPGGNTFYELESVDKAGVGFNGYPEQVNPVFLREHHLTRMGFEFDEIHKVHFCGHFRIAAFYYIEGDNQHNKTFGCTNYRIIPLDLPIPPTKDQLKQQTVEIPFIHVLQNYCADNKISIAFDKLNDAEIVNTQTAEKTGNN